MRLILSDEPDVYGTMLTQDKQLRILFTNETDGIRVMHGDEKSIFNYIITVPRELHDEIVSKFDTDVFDQAIHRMCELLV